MKVEYAQRAVADLAKIAADSRMAFGDRVALAIETRLRNVVARIRDAPLSGRPVANRPGVYVVPLVRYPFRLFYRALPDRVRILPIRHTSRRAWK